MIDMDRLEKTINIAGASVFGALGLAALGGVLFAGATHQWVMVGICTAMTAASIAEIRRENRKAGVKPKLSARAIWKQFAIAISGRSYPTAYVPMKYWIWHCDGNGNVKYRHWRTLWKYITEELIREREQQTN